MAFKDTLKELRNSRNLSQAKLAELLNISKSTIGMYETGDREPDIEMLMKIADFFRVDLNRLLIPESEDQDLIIDLNKNNGLIPVGSRYMAFKQITEMMDDETFDKWIEMGKVLAGK